MTKDIGNFRDIISSISGVTSTIVVGDTKQNAIKVLFSDGSVLVYCLGKEYGWCNNGNDYVVILDVIGNISTVVAYDLFKTYKNSLSNKDVQKAEFGRGSLPKSERVTDTLIAITSSFERNLRSICNTAEIFNISLFVHNTNKKNPVISIEVVDDRVYSVSFSGMLFECCIC